MEAEKSTQHQSDLAAYRRRYNRLILAFKLFFISLALITLAIITYLIQSESSSSSLRIYNPIAAATESGKFNHSLQSAADELQRAASLTNSASCRQGLQIATLHLREAIRISQKPSEEQRVQMGNWITAAEEIIDSCLDDPSAAPDGRLRAALVGAAADLRDRGVFLMSRRAKMLRGLWKAVSDVILENMIVVCACALQMLFVFFLFWTIIKSR
ncbi:hypothetical protein AAHA92_01923 [Salvia divinorum]|uniref:Pectinesterase inhibitor domain-containing protein n=1 Tax=Salvia divinorum TaxID=28513 RepID=A0ABD1IC46_SALDI